MGRKVGSAEDEKKDEEDEEEPTRLGIPGVCVRIETDAMARKLRYKQEEEEVKFQKLLKVWDKAREKNERLLRPRLGSPDAADELKALDDIEQERSAELTQNIQLFRAKLVTDMVTQTKEFCEDLGLSYTSLVQYIDTSMRLDALQLPPGTAIPKKRLTLKRMRKAQRLRDAVAAGGEDQSKEREWPAMAFDSLTKIASSAEDMVNVKDPAAAVEAAAAAAAAAAEATKGKKGKAPPPAAAATGAAEGGGTPLLEPEWIESVIEKSKVRAAVTTAARSLLTERDAALELFSNSLKETLEDVRAKYSLMLNQEASFNMQWNNQVAMLRNGKL